MATALNGNIFKEIDEASTSEQVVYTAPSGSGARSQISKLTLIYKSGESLACVLTVHKIRNGGSAGASNMIYKVSVPTSITTWQTVEFGEGHILEASDCIAIKLDTAARLADGCGIVGSAIEIT